MVTTLTETVISQSKEGPAHVPRGGSGPLPLGREIEFCSGPSSIVARVQVQAVPQVGGGLYCWPLQSLTKPVGDDLSLGSGATAAPFLRF